MQLIIPLFFGTFCTLVSPANTNAVSQSKHQKINRMVITTQKKHVIITYNLVAVNKEYAIFNTEVTLPEIMISVYLIISFNFNTIIHLIHFSDQRLCGLVRQIFNLNIGLKIRGLGPRNFRKLCWVDINARSDRRYHSLISVLSTRKVIWRVLTRTYWVTKICTVLFRNVLLVEESVTRVSCGKAMMAMSPLVRSIFLRFYDTQ